VIFLTVLIYLFVVFLSVLGLCDLIHSCRLLFLKSKTDSDRIIFCLLKDAKAELRLSFVIEQYKWHGDSFCNKIVAVNCLDDKVLAESCETICKNSGIEFISLNDVHDYIDVEFFN
jgi:hypothetical protein